jgi:acetoin utilization deacetylase AcuC-like enzyme
MHTFYYPDHALHDPAQMYSPDTPELNQFFCEIAQRGNIIHDAMQAAGFGPLSPPGDFSLEPIGDIHDFGLINLLQNAFERMANEEASQTAIPNTFPRSHPLRHKPNAIWGQLGYYSFDTASPIFEHTWDVAYWNAQVAVSAAALINAKGSGVAYALCRPPGHHAGPNFYGGYCYLNNAAIAANWLVQQGLRLAILDLDYHHGNGTQAVFYGRSDVLFCSIHADPRYAYPYFWGYGDEFGVEAGEGFNYNFPLPRQAEESAYLDALKKALSTIRLYVPDILLISFGADISQGDPKGNFQLPAVSLSRIGQEIAEQSLPMIVVQEGGYDLVNLGASVVAFFNGLLGK